ncbi:unnamed protein product [Rotaria magnacalcarata]|uniref:Ribosomal protein L7 n=1 Tax=Rotaria magnacalcarata TaxID=392030 RepID=A0A819C143_9BILA|nr:unnamed protein product [Rotaria magnacalcarata]
MPEVVKKANTSTTPKKAVQKVPEVLLKKRKLYADLKARRLRAQVQAVKDKKYKRLLIFKRAEKYASEYRKKERDLIRLKRSAKIRNNYHVDAEPALAFVMRIRGIRGVHPRVKQVLRLFRLRQINNGVFVKLNKATIQMLRIAEPYIAWGYPNLKSVRELIYKRGFGKVNKQRIPLSDNSVIERNLGKQNIICMEDLVHEIFTVGDSFKKASNFLWPFKLNNPKGGWRKKANHFADGGDFGNREQYINRLLPKVARSQIQKLEKFFLKIGRSANPDAYTVSALLGLDTIHVANQASCSNGSGSHPYAIDSSDFNNDDVLDHMIANSAHATIDIRSGHGNGTFIEESTYPADNGLSPQSNDKGSFINETVYSVDYGSHPCFIKVNSFNKDNRIDLAIVNRGTSTVDVLLSFDYRKFRIYSSFVIGLNCCLRSVGIGNFNNDSLLDVDAANEITNNVGILLGYDNRNFKPQKTYSTRDDSTPHSITAADFNREYGNGSFGNPKSYSLGYDVRLYSVTVGNLNKDSWIDMTTVNYGTDNVDIFLHM